MSKDLTPPLCVTLKGPPTSPFEIQERGIVWKATPGGWQGEWKRELSMKDIASVAEAYLGLLGPTDGSIRVDFLAKGSYNKAYIISTRHKNTREPLEAVFRVSLPIVPYFKVQSEVATMQYVRELTSIPVPRVYAFDSSSDNALGYEWILMEKIRGKDFGTAKTFMTKNQQLEVYKAVADWMHQLSCLNFPTIGSLYRQWDSTAEDNGEYTLGPVVLHDFLRVYPEEDGETSSGPFETVGDYFRGILQHQVAEAKHASTTVELAKTLHSRNTVWNENTVGQIDELSEYCARAIDKITASTTLGPESCYLRHWDVAARNVMISSEDDKPIALLDWEFVFTEPFQIRSAYPPVVDGEEELGVSSRKEKMSVGQCKSAFYERLSQLNSPYLEALGISSSEVLQRLNRGLSHLNRGDLETFKRKFRGVVGE